MLTALLCRTRSLSHAKQAKSRQRYNSVVLWLAMCYIKHDAWQRPGELEVAPYTLLVEGAWIPRVRQRMSSWDPRSCDECISMIERWQSLLPQHVFKHVLNHLVTPKLTRAVNDWNPRRDPVPIHAWLHPWLPLLGNAMEPLYAPIRHKLSAALRAWKPRDPSAHAILQPWKQVFDSGSMDALVMKVRLADVGMQNRHARTIGQCVAVCRTFSRSSRRR